MPAGSSPVGSVEAAERMTDAAGHTDRRTFLKQGAVLGGAGILAPGLLLDRSGGGAPDLVIRGGFVIDGSGDPGRIADLAITAGRVTAIGRIPESGVDEIDARGLVVAPGFIDIHSHADLNLLVEPRAESRIRQGVTTEVTGQDGSSILWTEGEARDRDTRFRRDHGRGLGFRDLGGFFEHLERNPVAVNVASMVGHGTLRGWVVGYADRPATADELVAMRRLLRTQLEQGAVGLSAGLEYTPGAFATTSELIELSRELVGTGLPFAAHMRNEDDRLLMAVHEVLKVGREAGVPVQISHLKAQGRRNWWKAELALEAIDDARASGVDVHLDRYPYLAYATGLSNLFPAWSREGGHAAFRRRLGGERGDEIRAAGRDKVALLGGWNSVQITSAASSTAWARGRRLGDLASERGVDPFDLTLALLDAGNGTVGMIGFAMDEDVTGRILAHPLAMPCSDGGAYAPYGPLGASRPHPRVYGSFPRYFGHWVRDRGILPIEEAVRRATSLPAAKLGLDDRGRLAVGCAGDVVAFDPDTVADTANFEEPHGYPIGIPHVVVSGTPTIRDGEHTGATAGRPVRGRVARGRAG